ncbi:MAG: hypothetical protein IMHGJWDQ_001230 [Candidatus Fervidibacter sp.]
MVMPIAFALPCLQGAFSAETLREKVGGVTIGLAGIDWLGIDDCGDRSIALMMVGVMGICSGGAGL